MQRVWSQYIFAFSLTESHAKSPSPIFIMVWFGSPNLNDQFNRPNPITALGKDSWFAYLSGDFYGRSLKVGWMSLLFLKHLWRFLMTIRFGFPAFFLHSISCSVYLGFIPIVRPKPSPNLFLLVWYLVFTDRTGWLIQTDRSKHIDLLCLW